MDTNRDAGAASTESKTSADDADRPTADLPTSEAEIDELRKEIDRLDAEILAAVKRRSEISRAIGQTRMAQGGPRLVHSREMKVLQRFSELGQEGHTLAMLLLRLGRGRLGH
ncbi:chorismate mutase [Rhodococcus sp. MEB064]|nr:chorismate mutase [Rhodococcus sp. MEB064]